MLFIRCGQQRNWFLLWRGVHAFVRREPEDPRHPDN